jgi:hypothetical protein
MNMGDFLKQFTDKLGAQAASNMAKAANEIALMEILIAKGVFTREEFGAELEKQLDKIAKITSNPDALEDF